jgi:hypothetical protein
LRPRGGIGKDLIGRSENELLSSICFCSQIVTVRRGRVILVSKDNKKPQQSVHMTGVVREGSGGKSALWGQKRPVCCRYAHSVSRMSAWGDPWPHLIVQ